MAVVNIEPWFVHDDIGAQSKERLLLVTYHFPPDSAIGARRWEKMAQYVAERGWGLDVITREMPVTEQAFARLQALPAGVKIYSLPVEPLQVQQWEDGLSRFVRSVRDRKTTGGPIAEASISKAVVAGSLVTEKKTAASPAVPALFNRESVRWGGSVRNLLRAYWATVEHAQFLPWGKRALQLAKQITHAGNHLAVISSGPPHMMHDVARRISVATGVPFVMDMRDPWSLNEQIVDHLASPMWYRIAERFERKAVKQASLVVANTELARRGLVNAYPDREGDIITIMNGADEDPIPPSRRGGKFVIAHAGTIYLDRDPRALFQASARLIADLNLTPDDFGLEFIGSFESGGYPIHDVIRQEGLERYVTVGASRPHAQAMEFMANATMNVAMSGSNVTAIPAKTFECVRFEAWLLALSEPHSATALLLNGTDADVVGPTDVNGIADVLAKRYRQYTGGTTAPRIGDDPRFGRRQQANLLLDAISLRRSI